MTRPVLEQTDAIAVRSFGLTDPGRVRPSNEDQFLVAELGRTLWVRQSSVPQSARQHAHHRGHLLLVADGMGGHQAGEVASALSVTTIESFVLDLLRYVVNLQSTEEQDVLRDFQAALSEADARIVAEAAQHPEWAGMGTTLTLAFISGRKLFVFHAGDSRCYLYRGGEFRQLTTDHTLVAELARRGVIRPEDVAQNRLRHAVTNVLGGPVVGVRVEVHQGLLDGGDVLLLCSDGLTEMLSDDDIAAVLAAESEPQAACERLVAAANEQGGQDNITAVVARFDPV
jgi:protein phosphatase